MVLFLLLLAASVGRAQDGEYAGSFLEIPVGARALAMGGAFTAIADDGSAFYWNPAGIGLIENKLLSGMYSSQYGSLGAPLASYFHAGWTMPVGGLGFSVNWIRFAISDIPYHDDLTGIQSVEERYRRVRAGGDNGTFNNTEDAFFFGFARNNLVKFNLGWSYFDIPLEIPIGANLKIIRQSLADNSASGIGVDIGAMLRMNLKDFFFTEDWPVVIASVAVKDATGTQLTWARTSREEEIHQSISVGVAVVQPIRPYDSRVTLSYDRSSRYDGESAVGLEVKYHRQFSFRLGANRATFTAGAGVDFNFFDIDYAYLASSQAQLGQVHRLAVAFNFDKLLEKPQQ
jgi:hypothetical protein